MAKKLIVIILCVCMLFNFAAQPVHAMGAEGIIIGGAAAAGVTLTIGQVALIAAAGFGLIYAVTHADELGAMLESALSSAASNDKTRLEQLTSWKTNALAGFIAITTAPAWIKGVINNWATDTYETVNAPVAFPAVETYPPKSTITGTQIWLSKPDTWSFIGDSEVIVLRAGRTDIIDVNGTAYYNLSSMITTLSKTKHYDAAEWTNVGGGYWYKNFSAALNPSASSPLEGTNKAAYDAISTLPDFSAIKERYSGRYSKTQEIMIAAWIDGLLETPSDSICPDVTVGGIGNALEEHSIDNINIPDINVGQSDLLVPDNTASINDTLNDVLTRLEQQELTWQQYMDDVAVGTPTVSVPAEGTETGTLEYPLTDTGVSDVPIDTTQPGEPGTNIPEGIEPYTLDLRNFFPFCIPFDIVKFVDTLCAEPEAPCFTWGIATPDGGTEEIEVDLAVFDPVAEILRGMELLLFIIGLAFLTRALIRG